MCVYKTERKSMTDGWSKSGWRQRRRVMAGIHLASAEALKVRKKKKEERKKKNSVISASTF